MKIAYFSPFSPQKSGISDYSEALLPYLDRFCDIDIWINGFHPNHKEVQKYRIVDYKKSRNVVSELSNYDIVVYNIGNNPEYHADIYDVFLQHPGVVILHDVVIYFLVTGYFLDHKKSMVSYFKELYYNYDDRGILWGKDILKSEINPLRYADPGKLPLVRTIIDRSYGIVVHSHYSKQLLLEAGCDASKVSVINHLNYRGSSTTPSESEQVKARNQYGINESDILIASFGYIAPTKRNLETIYAVKEVLKNNTHASVKYLMVGEGGYVDNCLNSDIIKTGFVTSEVFEKLLYSSDIVVNLRYPSMGETSATLMRAMTIGKPCIVSDHGWFSELPGDAVFKVNIAPDKEHNELTRVLENFIADENERIEYGSRAKKYCQTEHDTKDIAQKMICFFQESIKYNGINVNQDIEDFIITEVVKKLNILGAQNDLIIKEISRAIVSIIE